MIEQYKVSGGEARKERKLQQHTTSSMSSRRDQGHGQLKDARHKSTEFLLYDCRFKFQCAALARGQAVSATKPTIS